MRLNGGCRSSAACEGCAPSQPVRSLAALELEHHLHGGLHGQQRAEGTAPAQSLSPQPTSQQRDCRQQQQQHRIIDSCTVFITQFVATHRPCNLCLAP